MADGVTDNLDEETRRATRLADAGEWDALLDFRDDCRAALERGKQLWPVASYCEYRIALDGPADLAGRMLVADAGRFALGPLTEVIAVHHEWADIAAGAPAGPLAAVAAHERVVRGEDLLDADVDHAAVLELPLVLQSWEPPYPLADYKSDEAQFPAPASASLDEVAAPRVQRAVDDREAVDALTELASVWATESNGRVEVTAVDGDAAGAVAALGARRIRIAPITAADAFAHMAWAAASGGAHGRRRGMAPGRFAAWWVAAAVAGQLDGWPLPAGAMATLVTERLAWYAWDAGEPASGWALRIAVEDATRGRAYAISAVDASL